MVEEVSGAGLLAAWTEGRERYRESLQPLADAGGCVVGALGTQQSILGYTPRLCLSCDPPEDRSDGWMSATD